jgi:hypothetical protein
MDLRVTVYFAYTGLSPTIRFREVGTGTLVVTDESMVELADGFYTYVYTSADIEKVYAIKVDGGSSLEDSERYVAGIGQSTLEKILGQAQFLVDIQGGKWQIIGNQMIFYEADNVTEVARFNLFDNLGVPAEKNVYSRERV